MLSAAKFCHFIVGFFTRISRLRSLPILRRWARKDLAPKAICTRKFSTKFLLNPDWPYRNYVPLNCKARRIGGGGRGVAPKRQAGQQCSSYGHIAYFLSSCPGLASLKMYFYLCLVTKPQGVNTWFSDVPVFPFSIVSQRQAIILSWIGLFAQLVSVMQLGIQHR